MCVRVCACTCASISLEQILETASTAAWRTGVSVGSRPDTWRSGAERRAWASRSRAVSEDGPRRKASRGSRARSTGAGRRMWGGRGLPAGKRRCAGRPAGWWGLTPGEDTVSCPPLGSQLHQTRDLNMEAAHGSPGHCETPRRGTGSRTPGEAESKWVTGSSV